MTYEMSVRINTEYATKHFALFGDESDLKTIRESLLEPLGGVLKILVINGHRTAGWQFKKKDLEDVESALETEGFRVYHNDESSDDEESDEEEDEEEESDDEEDEEEEEEDDDEEEETS